MPALIAGILAALHGLVHLLYFAHTRRRFQLKPGLTWPDGSWAFSRTLGDARTRGLAGAVLVLITAALVVGGIGLLAMQGWSRSLVVAAAALSTLLYVLLWDGRFQDLDGKGLIGILINALIVAALLVFGLPQTG